jgi:hypothetical protein
MPPPCRPAHCITTNCPSLCLKVCWFLVTDFTYISYIFSKVDVRKLSCSTNFILFMFPGW